MQEERRLVWRVLRQWKEIAGSRRFPRRDEIDHWLRAEGGANCLLIAAESPIELSHFVSVGVNLAIALSHNETLAGVLLLHVPKVVSAQRGLLRCYCRRSMAKDLAVRSVMRDQRARVAASARRPNPD
jgi:hypothetical protein